VPEVAFACLILLSLYRRAHSLQLDSFTDQKLINVLYKNFTKLSRLVTPKSYGVVPSLNEL